MSKLGLPWPCPLGQSFSAFFKNRCMPTFVSVDAIVLLRGQYVRVQAV